jgi:hypothetical protein
MSTSPAFNNTSTALKMQSEWLNKIYTFITEQVAKSAESGLFKHHFTYNKTNQEFTDHSQWPPVKYPLSYPMLSILKQKMEADEYRVSLSMLPQLRRNVDVKVSWKPKEFLDVMEHEPITTIVHED